MSYYLGLISGTSMDGCDAAIIECIRGEVRLVSFLMHPLPDHLRQRILDCCSLDRSNIALVCSVNAELGYWFAQAAKAVCIKAGMPLSSISAIGSHGQTVYHIPKAEGDSIPSTLQLGEPAIIAYETGVAVVSAMRAMDMAAGGQGAPLVPFSEYLLYRGDEAVALQNLGGIGNVTVLPANCRQEDVFAFDTGPGNMIIDGLVKRFYNLPYDADGKLAAKGSVREDIVDEWMSIPYVDAPPPKSTGRELYGDQFVEAQMIRFADVTPDDLIATATAYTARSMRRNYELYVFPRCPGIKRIVLGGGGAHNGTLLGMLRRAFPVQTIQTQEDLGWDSDAKEAVAFAIIARETMHRRSGNIPSATGARQAVPLGAVTYPPKADSHRR